MGQYTQSTFEGKKRLSVDIDAHLMRLVKSKAAMQDRTLSNVVDDLLRRWVNGERSARPDDRSGK